MNPVLCGFRFKDLFSCTYERKSSVTNTGQQMQRHVKYLFSPPFCHTRMADFWINFPQKLKNNKQKLNVLVSKEKNSLCQAQMITRMDLACVTTAHSVSLWLHQPHFMSESDKNTIPPCFRGTGLLSTYFFLPLHKVTFTFLWTSILASNKQHFQTSIRHWFVERKA